MQNQNILYRNASSILRKNLYGQLNHRVSCTLPMIHQNSRRHVNSCHMTAKIPSMTGLDILEISHKVLLPGCIKGVTDESRGELSDDADDDLCPVDCVREYKSDKEFLRIFERAKGTNSLVVVDFYQISCGSCKYIAQGFSKLCKDAGDKEAAVIFLKHNVIDEYDEQSEVAERLRIKAVPLFHFYKNGVLLEAFPTRDKEKILVVIMKYTYTAQDA